MPRLALVLLFESLGLALGGAVAAGCAQESPPEAARTSADRRLLAEQRSCRDGDHARERYGTICSCCHDEQFGVAGSIAERARVESVVVEGADGVVLEMAPNPYGNFFRHTRAEPPLKVRVRFADGSERRMVGDAPHGSCNACHGEGTLPRLGGGGPPAR